MGQMESKLLVDEDNFYKISHLVLDEIPAKLRDFFKKLWNAKYPAHPWLDTPACGQHLLSTERSIQRHIRPSIALGNRKEWDGTTLFAVLLFSSHSLLPKNTPIYQAIDNLRLCRNNHYGHLNCASIDTPVYQQIIADVKTSFVTLNWSTNGITAIENRKLQKQHGLRLWKAMQEEKTKNDALENRLGYVETDVTQLQTDTAQLQLQGTQLNSDIIQLGNHSARLKADITQLQTSFTQLEADSIQLQKDVVQVQTDVTSAHIGIKRLEKEVGKLQMQSGDLYQNSSTAIKNCCKIRNINSVL